MKKLIIEKDFWDIFPDAKVGVLVCDNLDNSIKDIKYFKNLIAEAQVQAHGHLTNENFLDNKIIREWRNAFQKFKTKKGARSSIEALLKRVKNGNQINSINPLVDIYNSISLQYGFPCGGEDIEKIVGDIKLTKAKGDEEFITLGTNEIEPPYENELVYKDDLGAICRCLNWRESTRTILTENTKKALLCLEVLDSTRIEELKQALAALSALIQKNLGGECHFKILDQTDSSFTI